MVVVLLVSLEGRVEVDSCCSVVDSVFFKVLAEEDEREAAAAAAEDAVGVLEEAPLVFDARLEVGTAVVCMVVVVGCCCFLW